MKSQISIPESHLINDIYVMHFDTNKQLRNSFILPVRGALHPERKRQDYAPRWSRLLTVERWLNRWSVPSFNGAKAFQLAVAQTAGAS